MIEATREQDAAVRVECWLESLIKAGNDFGNCGMRGFAYANCGLEKD